MRPCTGQHLFIKESEAEAMPFGREGYRFQWRKGALVLLGVSALLLTCLASARRRLPAEEAAAIQEAAAPAAQTEEKLIALTFDDGPSARYTPYLMDELARRNVKATFFLVGDMVEKNPEVVQRMASEGHQIAVHTYNHSTTEGLRGLSDAAFDAQVGAACRLLAKLTGQSGFMLRPPYGHYDAAVRRNAPGPIILWSVDPRDWESRNADKVTQHILCNAKDGSIVLLHDIFSPSVEAALRVVDALQSQGFRFVTVEELFSAKGVEMKRGEVYHSAEQPGS